jgi:aminoglycoside/choline kinase family phosphotransferase
MTATPEANILALFHEWQGKTPEVMLPLPVSGSSRAYYRLQNGCESWLAAFNVDARENEAFFYFTDHFLSKGLKVPRVYYIAKDRKTYFLEDLGDTTLFAWMQKNTDQEQRKQWYYKALRDLIGFQTKGGEGLDYSRAYPVAEFDEQAILWDLQYFKYYFLKLAGIPFDEFRLQQGISQLAANLAAQPRKFFMHRDYQSRNIMISKEELYYIDYQGGRKGSLTYDLASLLFNTRANLPFTERAEYLEFYYSQLPEEIKPERGVFQDQYYMMALARVLQALGASGYRGYFERKPYFLKSIPFGLRNLAFLLREGLPSLHPYLRDVLLSLPESETLKAVSTPTLNLRIQSFSYKNGLPSDSSGNGGGFVFDCRALPNPGRETAFRDLSGKDDPVVAYLKAQPETAHFLENAGKIVQQSVEAYLDRNFENLSVSFGCTGGQHRSVYCAERMADRFRAFPGLKVILRHLQLDGPH